jgi:ETC complex I subunit conserved region
MATLDLTPFFLSTVGAPCSVHQAKSHDSGPNSPLVMARVTRSNTRPVGKPSRGSFPFGAPPCRVYRPSPSVMQAGKRTARAWVLEFEPAGRKWIEPLMGWTGTDDPFAQIRLTFPTLAVAVDYAEQQGLDYRVIEPPAKRLCSARG